MGYSAFRAQRGEEEPAKEAEEGNHGGGTGDGVSRKPSAERFKEEGAMLCVKGYSANRIR